MVQTLNDARDGFEDGLTTIQTSVTSSVTLQMAKMETQAANMTGACSDGEHSKES